VTALPASTLTFKDGTSSAARLSFNQKYAYAVTTIFNDGRESGHVIVPTSK